MPDTIKALLFDLRWQIESARRLAGSDMIAEHRLCDDLERYAAPGRESDFRRVMWDCWATLERKGLRACSRGRVVAIDVEAILRRLDSWNESRLKPRPPRPQAIVPVLVRMLD